MDAARALLALGADPSLPDRWGNVPREKLEEWSLITKSEV
jgi:hypothetical protein